MKFAAILFLAFIAAAVAGPVSVQDNNIGDIVSVGISGSLKLDSQVDQSIVNVIVAALSQQGVVALPGQEDSSAPKLNFTPEMIEKFRELMVQH